MCPNASTKDIAGFTAYRGKNRAESDSQVVNAIRNPPPVKNRDLETWLNARGGAGTHHTRIMYVRVQCATEWTASVHVLTCPNL